MSWMSFNLPLILVCLTALTGVLSLVDFIFFKPARRKIVKDYKANHPDEKVDAKKVAPAPMLFDYANSFFPIILFVLLLRSFVIEPFRIPSGSLEPSLLIGDFILVNKYDYGVKLPVVNTKIIEVGSPKNGQIVVFHWPPNPDIDYIKRLIGKPGDVIEYNNKVISVNGKIANQSFVDYEINPDTAGNAWKVERRLETLNGVTHPIYIRPDVQGEDFKITVPPGHYFMMGDNRDASSDSRDWGFVPERNIMGRAFAVWFSWDGGKWWPRFKRLGSSIT